MQVLGNFSVVPQQRGRQQGVNAVPPNTDPQFPCFPGVFPQVDVPALSKNTGKDVGNNLNLLS